MEEGSRTIGKVKEGYAKDAHAAEIEGRDTAEIAYTWIV